MNLIEFAAGFVGGPLNTATCDCMAPGVKVRVTGVPADTEFAETMVTNSLATSPFRLIPVHSVVSKLLKAWWLEVIQLLNPTELKPALIGKPASEAGINTLSVALLPSGSTPVFPMEDRKS